MIEFGSVYLVVRDFEKSLGFYKKLLETEVSAQNKTRFAIFNKGGLCLCLLNGYFDRDHPDCVVAEGERNPLYDDYLSVAESVNSRKAVLNFGTSDLKKEYERIKSLNLGSDLTEIRYLNAGTPYYYFCLSDPDGNPVEITGIFRPLRENGSERAFCPVIPVR